MSSIWIDVTAAFTTQRYAKPVAVPHGPVSCSSYPTASIDPSAAVVHYTRASDSAHIDATSAHPAIATIDSSTFGNTLTFSGGYWILSGTGILRTETLTGDPNGETGSAGDCVYNGLTKPQLYSDGSAVALTPTKVRITYKEPSVPSVGQNIQLVVYDQDPSYADPCQGSANPWGAAVFPLIGDTIDDQVIEFDIGSDLGGAAPYAISLFVPVATSQDYTTYPDYGNEFHWVPIKKIEVFADVPSPFWTDLVETETDIDGTLSKVFNEVYVPPTPGDPGQPHTHDCPQGPPVPPPPGGGGYGDGGGGSGDGGGPCFTILICQLVGGIQCCFPINNCP